MERLLGNCVVLGCSGMVLGSRVALGSGVVLGCFWGGWWLVAGG